MVKVKQLVSSNSRSTSGSKTYLCATIFCENTERLAVAITVEEGLLFTCADSTCELLGNVGVKVEHAITEQFLGNLNGSTELVCANGNLREIVIAIFIGTFLVNPVSRTLRCDNRNFSFTTCRIDGVCESTEDAKP